jgi:hypothetical protein
MKMKMNEREMLMCLCIIKIITIKKKRKERKRSVVDHNCDRISIGFQKKIESLIEIQHDLLWMFSHFQLEAFYYSKTSHIWVDSLLCFLVHHEIYLLHYSFAKFQIDMYSFFINLTNHISLFLYMVIVICMSFALLISTVSRSQS